MLMAISDLGNNGQNIQHLSDDWHIVITTAVAWRANLKFTTLITKNTQGQCAVQIAKLLTKVNKAFSVGE